MSRIKLVILTIVGVGLSTITLAQQSDSQKDILLDVMLAAYNGGAQAYADKTNTTVHTLSKEELAELENNLAQLQMLVTDDNGEVDLNKVHALLSLASQSDYALMGIEASSLEKPLQAFQKAAQQGKNWQQALLELKAQNQPIIDRTLADISPQSEGHHFSDALSIIIGAGMALEEISQEQQPPLASDEAFAQEINYLKALAQQDMPTMLHRDTSHQFEAMIGRLKIAYADMSIGEHTPADAQANIEAIEYFLSQAEGELSKSQYDKLLRWLERMDDAYDGVQEQVIAERDKLLK